MSLTRLPVLQMLRYTQTSVRPISHPCPNVIATETCGAPIKIDGQ